MNSTPKFPDSRPLHLQTLDSLLAELISGTAVAVGEQETDFCLPSSDSRALLNWYRLNRSKWAGNVTASDVEALVSAVLTPPPVLPKPDSVIPKAGRRLRLARIVAHRFAGLHAYGTPVAPPPDFVFEPREPITLFEGWNGSGKTSLLNAVIWCLTGQLLRPQRPPEDGKQEFEGSFVHSADGADAINPHSQTPVTPLPNPARYIPTPGKPVPVDSWVELTFADPQGRLLPPVRRTQMRNARGKLNQTETGFETLGVDPAALRIGTLMPALLQYLQIGSTSDLGLAVAQLTGLAEISALAKHATRTRDKLRGELKKEREREVEQADTRFLEARGDLQKQFDEYPAMKLAQELPSPASASDLEQRIRSMESHFTDLKAEALRAAQAILGQGFDPADKYARDSLEATIGPARGLFLS